MVNQVDIIKIFDLMEVIQLNYQLKVYRFQLNESKF